MPRVLVVDDEFGIADALRDALTDDGYETDVAGNGQEGLAKMRERRPDLVILDFMMPVVDGAEVLRQMRAEPSLREVKVIFISAIPRDLIDEAPEADRYLTKPFPLAKLLEQVTQLIGRP